jgi:hypothetical protein
MGVEMPNDDLTKSTSFAAQHSVYPRRSLNIAPTDGSTKFNTIRIPLIPVACWKLNDPAFAFDSSFVSPNFKKELVPTSTPDSSPAPTLRSTAPPLTTLSRIIAANQECPAALFGHCDPAGSDDLNKTLGDRRAIAVYALLTRQPPLWAYLYDNPQVGDKWDLRMVQTMLQNVLDGDGHTYFTSAVNGVRDSLTIDAVTRFQNDAGLVPPDGVAGPKTRNALFGAYMDWLCTPDAAPASTTPLRMQAADFLGGAGVTDGDLPKMSLQSCGKLNPIKLLTADEMGGVDTSNETDGASKTQRNADDAPNRRVIMFLFEKGTTADSSLWPCPKVKESNVACKKAFWPDGDDRRTNGPELRLYEDTHDTMACRFYDRFAMRSPCERGLRIRLLRIWPQDRRRQRMPSTPYRLTVRSTTRDGVSNSDGLIEERNLPYDATCFLEWGTPTHDDSNAMAMYPYARTLALDIDADPNGRSLWNLAYELSDPPTAGAVSDPAEATDALVAFRQDYPHDIPATVNSNGTPKTSSKQA